MNESDNTDFFSKLWKCPIRRGWRYGRKFLFIFTLGVIMWISLDFAAIALMKPRVEPPFSSLVTHSLLTTIVSLLLTLTTHQLYLRMKSRFQLIKAFLPTKKAPPHDR